jgi:hypothetical protein
MKLLNNHEKSQMTYQRICNRRFEHILSGG